MGQNLAQDFADKCAFIECLETSFLVTTSAPYPSSELDRASLFFP